MQTDPDMGMFFTYVVAVIYVIGAMIVITIARRGNRRNAIWAIAVILALIAAALIYAVTPIERRALGSAAEQVLINFAVVGVPWILIGVASLAIGGRLRRRHGGS